LLSPGGGPPLSLPAACGPSPDLARHLAVYALRLELGLCPAGTACARPSGGPAVDPGPGACCSRRAQALAGSAPSVLCHLGLCLPRRRLRCGLLVVGSGGLLSLSSCVTLSCGYMFLFSGARVAISFLFGLQLPGARFSGCW
jgi:hypothetical protein